MAEKFWASGGEGPGSRSHSQLETPPELEIRLSASKFQFYSLHDTPFISETQIWCRKVIKTKLVLSQLNKEVTQGFKASILTKAAQLWRIPLRSVATPNYTPNLHAQIPLPSPTIKKYGRISPIAEIAQTGKKRNATQQAFPL